MASVAGGKFVGEALEAQLWWSAPAFAEEPVPVIPLAAQESMRCSLGTGKTFRAWNQNQEQLFPRSLREFVPEGHVAHFVVELVSNELNLGKIISDYGEGRGFPPHSPQMMTALLLYGYMRGVYSSPKRSQGCEERTAVKG